MATTTYHDKQDALNEKKLKELMKNIPDYCKDFFRGINTTTTPKTRVGYAYDLITFFNFLLNNNPSLHSIPDITLSVLESLKREDIEEYLECAKYGVLESVSDPVIINHEEAISRKLSTLKSFYRYFYDSERILYNPASIVKLPKLHTKEIITLEPNEVAILLDNIESGVTKTGRSAAFHEKIGTRDLALITLLLGTGIRVSECVGLDIDDVDLENCALSLIRKGKKEATVYFSDEVLEALLPYYEERKLIAAEKGHEKAFFLSLRKKRISVRSVETIVKNYAKTAAPLKKITPHKLRSTYGTSLYRETSDIYLTAEVLGHENIQTTKKHYAKSGDDLKRSARSIVKLR